MKKYKRKKKVEEEEKSQPGKKNTRKWCRGKVGKEHKTEWKKPTGYGYAVDICNTYELICIVCSKKLDYCFNPYWRLRTEECKCGNHKETK